MGPGDDERCKWSSGTFVGIFLVFLGPIIFCIFAGVGWYVHKRKHADETYAAAARRVLCRRGTKVRAIAPIAVDEEICISYADSVGDVTARRKVLRDSFFFDCACERCTREETTPTPSFVVEGDAAAKATALEASSDPTARLVYAPLARCLESESKGEPLSPHVGGIVLENLRHAFGPAFGEEWGDRRIYPQ